MYFKMCKYQLLPFTNRYDLVAIMKNSVKKARFSPTPRAQFSEQTLRKGKELPKGFSVTLLLQSGPRDRIDGSLSF
ncbi:hypothetical protein Y032_0221g2578 [Ancylostoma ceylanicum]|uniref:Uncharacterized protein n=1 Tax=Ancylostoma ceylanicum TaxID=53326 RepID=A0A016SJ79_9BILA|nr:hypothetical protein Y032_0221g2578 [Ancylostoma ceylanicum]